MPLIDCCHVQKLGITTISVAFEILTATNSSVEKLHTTLQHPKMQGKLLLTTEQSVHHQRRSVIIQNLANYYVCLMVINTDQTEIIKTQKPKQETALHVHWQYFPYLPKA